MPCSTTIVTPCPLSISPPSVRPLNQDPARCVPFHPPHSLLGLSLVSLSILFSRSLPLSLSLSISFSLPLSFSLLLRQTPLSSTSAVGRRSLPRALVLSVLFAVRPHPRGINCGRHDYRNGDPGPGGCLFHGRLTKAYRVVPTRQGEIKDRARNR